MCMKDASDASEHCRANLDSIGTLVERQILSAPVNKKLFVRLVTAKQIGHKFEVTNPTCSKGKFQSRHFEIPLILRKVHEIMRIMFGDVWTNSECNACFW